MRVKSAELKTHLARYLRLVQETGEEIEVCVREKPVAYLTPAREEPMNAARNLEIHRLEAAFQAVGLTLAAPASPPAAEIHLPMPALAEDGRADLCTVEEMRGQQDW